MSAMGRNQTLAWLERPDAARARLLILSDLEGTFTIIKVVLPPMYQVVSP